MSNQRPLSPHLQVYKPQLTSILSITHRATGAFLYLGAVVLVAWISSLASSAECFAWIQGHMQAWYGQMLILGWTFSIFYHLANGIRHLFWDAGAGFELKQVYISGWLVVLFAAGLTALSYFIVCERLF